MNDPTQQQARRAGYKAGLQDDPNAIPYYHERSLEEEWYEGFAEGVEQRERDLDERGEKLLLNFEYGQEDIDVTVARLKLQTGQCVAEIDQYMAAMNDLSLKIENHAKGIVLLTTDELAFNVHELMRRQYGCRNVVKRSAEVHDTLNSLAFSTPAADEEMAKLQERWACHLPDVACDDALLRLLGRPLWTYLGAVFPNFTVRSKGFVNHTASILPEFEHEMAHTRKVLELVPDDKLEWKADPNMNSIGWNANHIAETPSWVRCAMSNTSYDFAPLGGAPYESSALKSRWEILDLFDKNVAAARQALAAVKDEATMEVPWSLLQGGKLLFMMSRRTVIRNFVINHLIYYRAHLRFYLRLVGIPVPDMYGP